MYDYSGRLTTTVIVQEAITLLWSFMIVLISLKQQARIKFRKLTYDMSAKWNDHECPRKTTN